MRRAGVFGWLLVAVSYGWSQGHTIDQQLQLRWWSDFSTPITDTDQIESQRILQRSTAKRGVPGDDQVSVYALRHKPPGKAIRAFSHGLKEAGAGDLTRAAHDFARTVAIDPDYAEAHGNLGVMYLNLGLPDQAALEFRRAIELDPRSSVSHSNLALALIQLKRLEDAEPEARTAVDLDHSNVKARYLLGLLWALHPETLGRAAENLQYAARQMPERSEERRVGKECRRLCRSRWSPYH